MHDPSRLHKFNSDGQLSNVLSDGGLGDEAGLREPIDDAVDG